MTVNDARRFGIRPVRDDEAEAMTALAVRAKAHWGYDDDFMRSCRAELELRPGPGRRYYCRVMPSGVVGFVGLARIDGGELELDALYVEPQSLGKGYGRQLLEYALDRARCSGARRLLVQSDPNAAGFYTRLGARRIGTKPSASIPGRDLPWLEIRLQP